MSRTTEFELMKKVKQNTPSAARKKEPSIRAPALSAEPISRVKTIRLELYAPQAREVFVAGSFNDWRLLPAASAGSHKGKWARELALAPGSYEYLFVVDGQWMADPVAKAFVPNPFGGQNSLLQVSAGAPVPPS